MCEQCDERKQAQPTGGGSQDCQFRPLPLRFNAQMCSRFLKGDFQLPAQYKPFHDLLCRHMRVGTQQRLWLELSRRVSDQDPTDAHRRHTTVI